MEMSSIPNQMSSYGEDVLFEVWSNGRRYAIGREGDPDDADHDQRMAVPLRVLQLLANEARSRQRRRQREEEEREQEPEMLQVAELWEDDEEAWEWGDEDMDLEMEGEPPQTRHDNDMRDVEVEDVRML